MKKKLKNIQTFEQHTDKNLNISDVSESVSDDYVINGSGLFHWNSSIKKEVKLKMVEWYNNLSSEERQYVDDLRYEAAMEEYDSHCGAEL